MNNVTNDIFYIGVNDHQIDLFEGQYDVPNGMAYNSYIIMDEKIAVFDTVDGNFTEQWLKNNEYTTPIYKWNTPLWGEIPADFGRK